MHINGTSKRNPVHSLQKQHLESSNDCEAPRVLNLLSNRIQSSPFIWITVQQAHQINNEITQHRSSLHQIRLKVLLFPEKHTIVMIGKCRILLGRI